jgi:predicted ribosomally synthesized peptide with SipW-like signal peptide
LAIIGVVAGITAGVTVSYFSDTETSTGNTFTAGSIDLKVDNHCWYNGEECVCTNNGCVWESGPNEGEECFCTWSEKDLKEGDVFFDFADLKPGDWGEDTISLHVHENDAWACAAVKITKNDDVSSVEPELEAGDAQEDPNNDFDGELAQELNFFFWADICDYDNRKGEGWEDYPNAHEGDNIYQPNCDIPLMEGPASELGQNHWAVYTLADFDENNVGGEGPLLGSHTYYIGKMWCFGDFQFDDGGNIIGCDGADVDNMSQTDEVQGDIMFYAVQSRNNESFECGTDWNPNENQ